MQLNKYLSKIQEDDFEEEVSSAAGMGFAIDSFPEVPKKKKKREVLNDPYPNESYVVIEMSRRAMIDLDGTIHKYSKGYGDGTIYDEPFAGAKAVIAWLKNKGYEIVIFTTRASEENALDHGQDVKKEVESVENWLSNNGIYYDRVTAEKLAADFYIDDKAIQIKNGNWKQVMQSIKQRVK
jgi:hypothetical protein